MTSISLPISQRIILRLIHKIRQTLTNTSHFDSTLKPLTHAQQYSELLGSSKERPRACRIQISHNVDTRLEFAKANFTIPQNYFHTKGRMAQVTQVELPTVTATISLVKDGVAALHLQPHGI